MKSYWVFYFNYDHGSEADQFIEDGLGWHGEDWWDANTEHKKAGYCIESEEVEAYDMDDGIDRTKVSISFDKITRDMLNDLSSHLVPDHLITTAVNNPVNLT